MDNQTQRPSLTLIFLYGKGGAGKDSTGERMVRENPSWSIISTGDRIKQARNPNDEFHPLIAPYEYLIDQGKNLPLEVVLNPENPEASIFPAFVESELGKGTTTIISTGFPRTLAQLTALDTYLAKLGKAHDVTQNHLYLDVTDETVRRRIRKRREIYAREGRPVRSDDADELIERRLATFTADTLPLVEYLLSNGWAHKINAEGTIDEVHDLIEGALRQKTPLGIKTPDEISLPGKERV